MRLKIGSNIKRVELPALDNTNFDLDSLKGKPFMISFLRFASCPFCNLRVNQLVNRFDEFGDDFTIVAIFNSSLENLKKHSEKHKAPFYILADEKSKYYKEYAIENSVIGMFKGMLFRLPTLLKGLFKGYVPMEVSKKFTIMPADFLVDRDGIISEAYYAKDEGDHLPFDKIKEFSLKK